jgi:cytochrome c-type biogenesis protein CcmF
MTPSLAGLGYPSLVAAGIFAAATAGLSLLGALKKRPRLVESGARALRATALFVAAGTVALLSALLANDFSLSYVASYTSRSLSRPYTLAALWGGMEGSILFWTLLLTCFGAVAVSTTWVRDVRLRGWAAVVLAGITMFFLALLLMPANPFTRLPDPPPDGSGLNPLLQSPGMLAHPMLLYGGFVGFSIPFAYAVAALITGRTDHFWFTSTRRWTLFAWSSLTLGIVVGGAWAYTELGWGGYWGWDPVENASFMPWLTATAFLHSVVVQERRGMLKVWNVVLILLTYALAIFGTFLTRSGILSSIHTFTEGPIGKWFLPFLGVMLLGGAGIIAVRMDALRSENRLDSPLSRESAFLANNVLFVAACFVVLWGTIYPILAEAFSGVRLSVGPPFFDAVFTPLALALLALSGIGPLISWRRMAGRALLRIVRGPLAAGGAVSIALASVGVRSVSLIAALGLSAFTAAAIAGEFARGSRVYRKKGASWPRALLQTIRRNRRRYGGYVIHLGVVLVVLGIAGAAFRVERQALLEPGDRMDVGPYTLAYVGVERREEPEKQISEAEIEVFRGSEMMAVLRPQRNFHLAQRQTQSEVAIRSTPLEDLYVVVTSFDRDGDAAIRAFVNPLTWWIWGGAGLMAVGMVVIMRDGRPTAVGEAPTAVARPATVVR